MESSFGAYDPDTCFYFGDVPSAHWSRRLFGALGLLLLWFAVWYFVARGAVWSPVWAHSDPFPWREAFFVLYSFGMLAVFHQFIVPLIILPFVVVFLFFAVVFSIPVFLIGLYRWLLFGVPVISIFEVVDKS